MILNKKFLSSYIKKFIFNKKRVPELDNRHPRTTKNPYQNFNETPVSNPNVLLLTSYIGPRLIHPKALTTAATEKVASDDSIFLPIKSRKLNP